MGVLSAYTASLTALGLKSLVVIQVLLVRTFFYGMKQDGQRGLAGSIPAVEQTLSFEIEKIMWPDKSTEDPMAFDFDYPFNGHYQILRF